MKNNDGIKVALIMPAANRYRYSGNKFVRPACSTLSVLYSLIPDDLSIKCSVYDESIENIDFNLINADIVGISAITSTANRAFAIADNFRKKGIYVVIGGVHASLYSEETLTHCDTIITGLAYKSWSQFLVDFLKGTPQKHYSQSKTINLENLKIESGECYLKKLNIIFIDYTAIDNNNSHFYITTVI